MKNRISVPAKRIVCVCLCALALSFSVSALPNPANGTASEGVMITPNDAGDTLSITSTERNNVIKWDTFNVDSGETVSFDNGVTEDGSKNYLNLISDTNSTLISGMIAGGNNVYFINPNGVIFDSDSVINVGNLHTSACRIEQCDIEAFQCGEDPLPKSDDSLTGDIYVLGEINADMVRFHGKTVRTALTDEITASAGQDGSGSPEGAMLSAGSLGVIVGVLCFAAGFTAAAMIFRKRKPVPADGAGSGEDGSKGGLST